MRSIQQPLAEVWHTVEANTWQKKPKFSERGEPGPVALTNGCM